MISPLRMVLAGMALMLACDFARAVSVKASVNCASWATEREKEKGAGKLGSLFNRRWLIGYLSGLATGRNKEFWDTPNASPLDYEAVFVWMDGYCRANPQKDIADGAARLFDERTRGK